MVRRRRHKPNRDQRIGLVLTSRFLCEVAQISLVDRERSGHYGHDVIGGVGLVVPADNASHSIFKNPGGWPDTLVTL